MVKSLKDRKPSDNKKILLIGDSGSGKTTFLGSVPGVHLLDADNGLDVLAGRELTYEEYLASNKPDSWARLKKDIDYFLASEAPPPLALDSLTSAAECALVWVLKKNNRAGRIEIGDWGEAISEVKDLVAKLVTVRNHVIVTAHYQMVKDEAMGGISYAPLLYGKDLPMVIPKYFNDCWRTFVEVPAGAKEPSYRMQVRPTAKFSSLKNTVGIKDIYVDKPNFVAMTGGK